MALGSNSPGRPAAALALVILCASASFTCSFAPQRTAVTPISVQRIIPSSTKLFSTVSAPALPEGVVKTMTQEGNGRLIREGDVAIVKFSCYLPNADMGTRAPFARGNRLRSVVDDGSMISAWDMAIKTMRFGERSVIRVTDPKYAYGDAGVPGFIPGGAEVEMDIEIVAIQDKAAYQTLGSLEKLKLNPNTPTTPAEIAAAYEKRKKEIAVEEANKKEGIEGMIEKWKTFYFFGFFEGETGQAPPWFLRPSITFPLAFFTVGAAFYVSLKFGAITQRGAQVQDELDEIIISSAAIRQSVLVALSTLGEGVKF